MNSSNLAKFVSITTAGAICVAMALTNSAQATTLTFDTPLNDPPTTDFLDGYGGFDWNNFGRMLSLSWPPGFGYRNGMVSFPHVIYNLFGDPAEISRSSLFTFNSAYFTGAFNNDLNILVEGFQAGTPLFSQTIVVDVTAPTLFNFNWSGIDGLRFTSFGGVPGAPFGFGGNHFVMDNFTFNESVSAVPTPALLPSLIGMGVAVWRKRNSKPEVVEKV
jgi:hypothetical protein